MIKLFTMAIPQVSGFSANSYSRPSDDIDPKLKQNDPQYSLDWSRFIYAQWITGNTFVKPTELEQMRINRAFASGRQDPEQYKNKFLKETREGMPGPPPNAPNPYTQQLTPTEKREGYMNIDFDTIFSPIPKYIENILGMFEDQEYDIAIDAIDENSGSKREEIKYKLYVQEYLADAMKLVDKVFDIPGMEQSMSRPKNMEEIQMLDGMGRFKLRYEIGMKKACRDSDNTSKLSKIKRAVIRDLLTIGRSATWTYIDRVTNRVRHKWINLEEGIFEDTSEEDGSDITYWAFIEYYNVVDLMAETGWTLKEIENIINNCSGLYGNPSSPPLQEGAPNSIDARYNSFRIPVLHSYWITADTEYNEQRISSDGKVIDYPLSYLAGGTKKPRIRNSETHKTTATSIRTIYTAKWVIDKDSTNMVFSNQRAYNIPYDFAGKDVVRPVHLFRLGVKPIVENMIPIEHDIQFTYLKFQNNIITAAPPGIAIEVTSINNLKIGNQKWKPLDTLRFRSQNGTFFYALSPNTQRLLGGGNNSGKPYEELKGGLGTVVADTVASLEMLYRQLDIITGIDPISSASKAPNTKTGLGVSEMAQASTSNTLKPIFLGFVSIQESQTMAAVALIQSIVSGFDVKSINKCPYSKIIGPAFCLSILSAMDFPPAEYGFQVKAKANALMIQDVRNAAAEALKNKVLKTSDYLFIIEHLETNDMIKYARMYIGHREAIYEKMLAEQNLKHAQEQNKGAIEAKKLEQENMIKKFEAQEKMEINVVKEKGTQERLTLDKQIELAKLQKHGQFEQAPAA